MDDPWKWPLKWLFLNRYAETRFLAWKPCQPPGQDLGPHLPFLKISPKNFFFGKFFAFSPFSTGIHPVVTPTYFRRKIIKKYRFSVSPISPILCGRVRWSGRSAEHYGWKYMGPELGLKCTHRPKNMAELYGSKIRANFQSLTLGSKIGANI